MYCPGCATKISLDQKFCRSCGLGLEKIVQSLEEQLPTKLDESLQDRKNRLERLGVAALSIFGIGALSIFLYTVGYKLMLTQGKFVAALGVLALLVILGCGIISVILFANAKEVEEARVRQRIQPSKEMPETEVAERVLPESHFEPVPSVVERTTELLFAEKKAALKDPE